MIKDDKQRLDELQGEAIHLQSQCYLMKKGLEVNEQKLAQVVALIAEYEAAETPKTDPGEVPPDA